MTLQIIKSIDGKAEYVLLPVNIYNTLRNEIDEALKKKYSSEDYVAFDLMDYVDNPIALARINAGITQETLAKHMKVTQAYISKLEAQSRVTAKVLKKVNFAIENGKTEGAVDGVAAKKRSVFEEIKQGILEAKAHKKGTITLRTHKVRAKKR